MNLTVVCASRIEDLIRNRNSIVVMDESMTEEVRGQRFRCRREDLDQTGSSKLILSVDINPKCTN